MIPASLSVDCRGVPPPATPARTPTPPPRPQAPPPEASGWSCASRGAGLCTLGSPPHLLTS